MPFFYYKRQSLELFPIYKPRFFLVIEKEKLVYPQNRNTIVEKFLEKKI